MKSDEFVPEWDVYRDSEGKPVTISNQQVYAIWHAIGVVEAVRRSENYESMWVNPIPNIAKSRLLGRILVAGRPPTKTKPPYVFGGPDWSALARGDPFAGPEWE